MRSPLLNHSLLAQTNHIAGGYFFNGAGVLNVIGNARTNQGVTTTQEGIGMFQCTVAGVQSTIVVSSYTVAAARCQIGAGTDTFIAGRSASRSCCRQTRGDEPCAHQHSFVLPLLLSLDGRFFNTSQINFS